jgi:ADP-glucose pyrophosphorylase
MRETKEEKLIAKTYYDLSNGSAFFGPRKIYEYLKKKNSLHAYVFPLYYIRVENIVSSALYYSKSMALDYLG